MKIKKSELKEIIDQKVKQITEGMDFSAKREIIHQARKASMDFEKEIVANLDLASPDEMSPEAQKVYHVIVREMESKIVQAVAETISSMTTAGLPKKAEPVKV